MLKDHKGTGTGTFNPPKVLRIHNVQQWGGLSTFPLLSPLIPLRAAAGGGLSGLA